MEIIAPQHIKEWFKKRTLSLEVLSDFGVHCDYDKNKIVIPVFSPDGKLMFNKYRRDPESDDGPKYSYDAGGKMMLYGAHRIGNAKNIVMVEGELDALCLWSHGFTAVSSTGGAGSFDARWVDLLADREVIICYDNDLPGARGAIKAQTYMPWAKIVQLPYRSDVKDITDFCIHHPENTHEELQKVFDKAILYSTTAIQYKEDDTIKAKKQIVSIYEDRLKKARDERGGLAFRMQPTTFIDVYIEHTVNLISEVRRSMKKVKTAPVFTGNTKSVESAKAYPIPNLLKFNALGMAPCLWHHEKTASLHYIKASNKVHCFGCNVTKDAIEVVMAQNNCSYADALHKLTL